MTKKRDNDYNLNSIFTFILDHMQVWFEDGEESH